MDVLGLVVVFSWSFIFKVYTMFMRIKKVIVLLCYNYVFWVSDSKFDLYLWGSCQNKSSSFGAGFLSIIQLCLLLAKSKPPVLNRLWANSYSRRKLKNTVIFWLNSFLQFSKDMIDRTTGSYSSCFFFPLSNEIFLR